MNNLPKIVTWLILTSLSFDEHLLFGHTNPCRGIRPLSLLRTSVVFFAPDVCVLVILISDVSPSINYIRSFSHTTAQRVHWLPFDRQLPVGGWSSSQLKFWIDIGLHWLVTDILPSLSLYANKHRDRQTERGVERIIRLSFSTRPSISVSLKVYINAIASYLFSSIPARIHWALVCCCGIVRASGSEYVCFCLFTQKLKKNHWSAIDVQTW